MRSVVVVVLAVGVLLALTACDETVIDGYECPPTSPAGIIESIEVSFNTRDINDLEECLAGDFTFYFDADEVGEQVGDYTVPESWTRADFLTAVVDIFDCAYSLDISIATSDIGGPPEGDSTFTAAEVPVEMLVMVEPVNGFIARGTFTFEFRIEYNEKNKKEWFVTAWQDFTSPGESGGRNVEEASFGEILVRFLKP
jgi:hypothetical protein